MILSQDGTNGHDRDERRVDVQPNKHNMAFIHLMKPFTHYSGVCSYGCLPSHFACQSTEEEMKCHDL